MSAPPSLAPQVHLHELCLLVHGFLRKYVVTFPETFAAFRRESAAFRDGVSAGGKVKTLESVMNEFLELKHARQVRQSFVSAHASAILEPRVHATLASIANLLDDYRLLRESPRVPVSHDLFENEHQDVRDSPHYAIAPNVPGQGGAPSSPRPPSAFAPSSSSSAGASSSSLPPSSSSSSSSFPANNHSARPNPPAYVASPAGGGRRKKKLPRRRKQTGTSMVLGKRNLDEIMLNPHAYSGGLSAVAAMNLGSYDVDQFSISSMIGADDGSGSAAGNVMHMSLNNLDVRSLVADPNLPDMLATQINRMAQSSSLASASASPPVLVSASLAVSSPPSVSSFASAVVPSGAARASAVGADGHSQHGNQSPSRSSHKLSPVPQGYGATNNSNTNAEASPRTGSPMRKGLRSSDESSITSVISALNEDPQFANIVASSAVGSGGSPSRREIEVPPDSANIGGGDGEGGGQKDGDGGDDDGDGGDNATSANPDSVKTLVGSTDLEGFLAKLHKSSGRGSEDDSGSSSGSGDSDSDSEAE
jgi:hypothetical protein